MPGVSASHECYYTRRTMCDNTCVGCARLFGTTKCKIHCIEPQVVDLYIQSYESPQSIARIMITRYTTQPKSHWPIAAPMPRSFATPVDAFGSMAASTIPPIRNGKNGIPVIRCSPKPPFVAQGRSKIDCALCTLFSTFVHGHKLYRFIDTFDV